jgi:murein hydrolase activator
MATPRLTRLRSGQQLAGPRLRASRLLLLLLPLLLFAPELQAQQDSVRRELRDSQLRLEQIRREREQLQREMERLRSQVRDATGEVRNIERQVAASAAALTELEFQATKLTESADSTTEQIARTRARQAERTVVLQQRVRSIYKRGPLHSTEVLLSAESFGDLLRRYKYLHLLALHDRAVIQEVARLEQVLVAKERELTDALAQIERVRGEKQRELAQLQDLESRKERALRGAQQQERQTQGRIQQLTQDETRLTSLIADLDRKRIEEERRRAAAGQPAAAGSITTRDLGSLRWPVDGNVVYGFGPNRRPNGVVLRHNGIGIGATAGTPVRAVEAGAVVTAGHIEGYGPGVVISHGGGFYTLYLYLGSTAVREGQRIEAGQVIGTVGGERTAEGPHIEFQVRAPVRGGAPEAVDPLGWLRAQAGR